MKQEETLEDVLRCDYLILMDLLHFHEFALNQHLDISLSQYHIYSHTTFGRQRERGEDAIIGLVAFSTGYKFPVAKVAHHKWN